jgi:hypothetical protein
MGGLPPNVSTRGDAPPSRSQAAREAGLSTDQRKTALRVARLPEKEFEDAIESDDPVTLTELAERGTVKKSPFDLGDRNPQDFKAATEAGGELRRLAEQEGDSCEQTNRAGDRPLPLPLT